MDFTKMQGAGNDFIIINNMKLNIPVEKLSSIARHLCQRRLSLGADGFMVVDHPEDQGDFKMRFYNSDGSIGEMCGNGARCIARYAYINKIADRVMRFETGAGIVYAEVLDKRQVKVQLNNPEVIILDHDIEIEGQKYESSYIELGKPGLPHAVVKYPNLNNTDEKDIFSLGRKIRNYEGFPKGANVNFYDLIGGDAIVKTYERGVEDFTLACGTGSASVALSLILKGYVEGNEVRVIAPGGDLFIEVERNGDKIYKVFLIANTNIVAQGNILDEDLDFLL